MLTTSTPVGSDPGPARPLHVFVLAGGTNMLGRGKPVALGEPADPRILIWRNGGWQTATDPLGPRDDKANGIGPGLTFARSVLELEPEANIGLVLCAGDASSIGDWQPTGALYRSCIGATRAAGGTVSGIAFLQGEHDAQRGDAAAAWGESFQNTLAAFRSDLGSDVPFVLGGIGRLDRDRYGYQGELREQQERAASSSPGVAFVRTADLGVAKDGVSFTVDAYKEVGTRLAGAWSEFGSNSSADGGAPGADRSPTAPAPPKQVFVLAGQSNMLGRGKPVALGSPADPRLFVLRGGVWKTASDPLGTSADGIGPGMTFGLSLLKLVPDQTIGMVMCAKGATSISDWQPSTALYKSCIAATKAGGGHVAGILFLQGESDAQTGSQAAAWGASFQKVLAAFRHDLGATVPFALGQIGKLSGAFGYQKEVRQAQAKAAASNPAVGLVTTSDLPVSNDGVHFTVGSYQMIGTRFTTAWWQLHGTSTGNLGKPTQVFVLAGQSNMLGRGKPITLDALPDPRLQLWRNGSWTMATDPLGSLDDAENGIGPGMTFGRTVLQLQPGVTIGLVMCARSATSIKDWQPAAPLYKSCISTTRAAGGTVGGILFMQGENDALARNTALTWSTGFKSMLTAFRADLGAGVPLVLGQIGDLGPVYRFQKEVRSQQAVAAAASPRVALVPTVDLPVDNDGVHFTVPSYRTLGTRFANAWWQLPKTS